MTEEERQALTRLVRTGKAAAYRRTQAQVLLWANESEQGSGLIDREVAHTVGVSEKTVVRVRQRFVEEGLDIALERIKAKCVVAGRRWQHCLIAKRSGRKNF